jgi:hypothetical protein
MLDGSSNKLCRTQTHMLQIPEAVKVRALLRCL